MGKRESFGSTLDKELLNDLRNLSDNTGIPISKLLDRAVTLLLEKQGMPRDKNQRNQDKMYIDINLKE
jgi:antitoxin component of RelBE/YafQ-DinJ toxin-antitoxin module